MQPAFLIAIFASEENNNDHLSVIGDVKQQKTESSLVPQDSKKSCLLDALMHYIEKADDLIKRYTFLEEDIMSSSVFLFLLTRVCIYILYIYIF